MIFDYQIRSIIVNKPEIGPNDHLAESREFDPHLLPGAKFPREHTQGVWLQHIQRWGSGGKYAKKKCFLARPPGGQYCL